MPVPGIATPIFPHRRADELRRCESAITRQRRYQHRPSAAAHAQCRTAGTLTSME